MPVLFRCKHCSSIIFIFERVGQDCFGLPSPTELINKFNGVCPHCGSKLSIPSLEDIKIVGRLRMSLRDYLSRQNSLNISPYLLESQKGSLRTTSVSQ